jgi:hypothetical protein
MTNLAVAKPQRKSLGRTGLVILSKLFRGNIIGAKWFGDLSSKGRGQILGISNL